MLTSDRKSVGLERLLLKSSKTKGSVDFLFTADQPCSSFASALGDSHLHVFFFCEYIKILTPVDIVRVRNMMAENREVFGDMDLEDLRAQMNLYEVGAEKWLL